MVVSMPATAQPEPEGHELRLIATTFRVELSDSESYATFRQAVLDHLDRHVSPLLAHDKPNIIVYPERLDRLAMLIGMRGQAARDQLADGANLDSARIALYGPYAPQIAYYRAQFDGLSDARYLQLALTDTIARSVVETFGEVARQSGAYVVVGAAVPRYEQLTGASGVLGDPEVGLDAAYVATEPDVASTTLVLGPDGAVVARRPKLFLDARETSGFVTGEGLVQGTFDDVQPVDLPFGPLGVLAGDDAFAPDLGDRLSQLGAAILVQPLSTSGWAQLPFRASLWPPDRFKRGTWLQAHRHPELRAAATSVLTGNLGSHAFDGQAAIAAGGRDEEPPGCLAGSGDDVTGWAALGNWTSLDLSRTDLCAIEKREALVQMGWTLAQGSGSPHEGAYAHEAMAVDLAVPSHTARGPRVPDGGFSVSSPVGAGGTQLWPSVAARRGGGAWVAWADTGSGHPRVMTAPADDGDDWSEASAVWPIGIHPTGHSGDQGAPSIVVSAPRPEAAPGLSVDSSTDAFVVFPRLDGRDHDIYIARHDSADDTWGSRARVDREVTSFFGDDDDAARAHARPLLAVAPNGGLVAVWSDLRWPYVHPQIRVARAPTADGWETRTRADGGPADPDLESASQPLMPEPAETRGQVAPTAAFTHDGTLMVAWQELSPEGGSSIYVARSPDAGQSFDPPRRVDGTSNPSFRPALAASGGDVWLVWEDEVPGGGRRLVARRSPDDGQTWTDAFPLGPELPPGARQSRAAVAADDGRAIVVFEDDRAGDTDVLAVTIDADGAVSPASRVDDGPDGAHARAPDVAALPDGRVLVAWQDDRDGVDRVRTAVRAASSGSGSRDGAPELLPAPSPVPLPATGGGAALAAASVLLALAARRRCGPDGA